MLETINLTPINTFEDIECYKMVYRHPKEPNKCISYVQGYEYTIGEENEPVDIKTDGKSYTDVDRSIFLVVREGYHSYASKDIQCCQDTCIARCIIPAGSRYFKDVYGKQYVSSNIIIKELL